MPKRKMEIRRKIRARIFHLFLKETIKKNPTNDPLGLTTLDKIALKKFAKEHRYEAEQQIREEIKRENEKEETAGRKKITLEEYKRRRNQEEEKNLRHTFSVARTTEQIRTVQNQYFKNTAVSREF